MPEQIAAQQPMEPFARAANLRRRLQKQAENAFADV
jgi:hypothetical protein